jgi:hypothetical protein
MQREVRWRVMVVLADGKCCGCLNASREGEESCCASPALLLGGTGAMAALVAWQSTRMRRPCCSVSEDVAEEWPLRRHRSAPCTGRAQRRWRYTAWRVEARDGAIPERLP